MVATTLNSPAFRRISGATLALFQKFLMLAGLVFVIGLVGVQTGNAAWLDGARALLQDDTAEALVDEPVVHDSGASVVLTPRMRGALNYVSRRYHVSTEALQPIFETAQVSGQELRIDPLLIIAVIGIESGFNPFSQSGFGAQGLMQVVPRFHMDKLPEAATEPAAFLDPVTNVQVGSRVLKESIQRYGGIEEGLQQFGGALNDPDRRYASRVLIEKQKLEQAALRLRSAS